MAWTTSAGPGDDFALASNDDGRIFGRKLAGLDRFFASSRQRRIAVATAAHLGSLAIVAPLIGQDPIIAIPVIIGLAVSCGILIYPQNQVQAASAQPSFTSADHDNESGATLTAPTRAQSPAAPLAGNTARLHAAISPAEVSAELRSELMARVSHELRTPLNAVMGFSDLMGHQLFGPLGHPRYEEYVSHIRESSQKLLKSAEDTLAMTSLMARSATQCDREVLELDGIAKSARSAVATDAGRRGISTLLMLDDEVEIVANRRALRQALVNILTGAIERAADGAEIKLSASSRGDKLALTISLDRTSDRSEEAHASLPMCLARALLELDGYRLIEHEMPSGDWSAMIVLDCATQRDFFTTASTI